MKWLGRVLGILFAVVGLVWLVGALLPAEHVATRLARYAQPPAALWEAITDVEAMPAWRTDLKSIRRLPDREGRPAWVETSSSGELPLVVTEWDPPRRLVTRIDDPELPFGGTWTYEIAAVEGGATLRITENGQIRSALFRFLARFLFSHTATMEQYLKDLGRKFGEDVTPAA